PSVGEGGWPKLVSGRSDTANSESSLAIMRAAYEQSDFCATAMTRESVMISSAIGIDGISSMTKNFSVFATCDIGNEALDILRQRGYRLEVYPEPKAPPKSLILEKVRSGIDGLITTLRDQIDAEVFEAGKGTLKVVAQYAVGFDNINRADANRYKVPFTNTADVLTEATAEFAFFMLGELARRLWPAEHLTREDKWGFWHPYLPFLGNEVTGKTIAIIGTGRIGLAMIKNCGGFDMNILCYDPAYQNREFVSAIQATMDLRQQRGIQKEKTWIKYASFEDAVKPADFVSVDRKRV